MNIVDKKVYRQFVKENIAMDELTKKMENLKISDLTQHETGLVKRFVGLTLGETVVDQIVKPGNTLKVSQKGIEVHNLTGKIMYTFGQCGFEARDKMEIPRWGY